MITGTSNNLPSEGYIHPVINPAIEHWSHFRCGSYTAEWVSRAVGIENTPSNFLLSGPVWFDLFRPIIPRDMRKLFKAKGMTTIEMHLSEFTLEEKLNWLKNEIVNLKRPPVVLIRTATLHWIAVGGYDDKKKLFYIYDSRIGVDSFGTVLPIGNSTMTYADMLFLWSGRMFWRYVAIVVTSINIRDQRKEKANELLESFTRREPLHKNTNSGQRLWPYR